MHHGNNHVTFKLIKCDRKYSNYCEKDHQKGALKMQDVKIQDQVARHENAGHENDGPSCSSRNCYRNQITKQKFSLNCKLNFYNVIHQSETAQFTKENIYALDPVSVSRYGLQIRTLDPDYFQNLTGTSLSRIRL